MLWEMQFLALSNLFEYPSMLCYTILYSMLCYFRSATDDYWMGVKSILAQLEGMVDGLVAGCPCEGDCAAAGAAPNLHVLDSPSITHLLLLNADGDLYQITEKFTQVDTQRRTRRRERKRRLTEDLTRRLSEAEAEAQVSERIYSL
jgi:hypothetical protein